MIGLRIKYTEKLTGTIIDENKTHAVILLDSGEKYCILKSGIEQKQIKLCGNCKYYTQNPIFKDRGWCEFDKVSYLIPEDRHCDRWEKKEINEK